MLILDRQVIYRALEELDFYSYGTLSGTELNAVAKASSLPDEDCARYRIAEAKSAIVVALRYGEGLYPLPEWAKAYEGGEGSAQVLIGRFARANWYAEIGERLKSLSSRLRSALQGQAASKGEAPPPMRQWQRAANSGLPEKPLAVAAGLGSLGRNQLLIAHRSPLKDESLPRYSSAVLLGVLLCPVQIGVEEEAALKERGSYPLCGTCRRCIDACPSGALATGPVLAMGPVQEAGVIAGEPPCAVAFSRMYCVQHWTAREGELPKAVASALPTRLYGCDSCLESCPYFKPDPEADSEHGRLGPALPADFFLNSSAEEIKRNLRGTALDMAWMSIGAFRRNARLAEKRPAMIDRADSV